MDLTGDFFYGWDPSKSSKMGVVCGIVLPTLDHFSIETTHGDGDLPPEPPTTRAPPFPSGFWSRWISI